MIERSQSLSLSLPKVERAFLSEVVVMHLLSVTVCVCVRHVGHAACDDPVHQWKHK